MLDAARAAPELTFIITGRQDKARQNGHHIDNIPPNVILPGYLDVAVFDDLLRAADVVVGLTLEEGIQLSVCNEALGFGRPLVTADTQILRALFGEAAILVNPRDPQQIVSACRLALQNSSEYAAKSVALAAKRLTAWKHEQLSTVTRFTRTNPRDLLADKSEGAQ